MGAVWAKRKTVSAASKRGRIETQSVSTQANIDASKRRHDRSIQDEPAVTTTKMDPPVNGIERKGLFSGNVRQSLSFDMQPDICKQYFQTGRCKYGDECKFLHERGDSATLKKSSWQKRNSSTNAAPPSAHPNSCILCSKDPPNDPVRAKCTHIACESCFLSAVKRDPLATCRVCGKELGKVADPL